jgi:hypothetical protein
MPAITLNQAEKSVHLSNVSTDHPLVFDFFNQLPEVNRDEAAQRALVIGVMALMEDRISAFLSRTENELGTHLESLKLLYDRRRLIEARAPAGGVAGEEEVYNRLKQFFEKRGWTDDNIRMTGASAGAMRNNRTGDLVVEFQGRPDRSVVVEVKFDRSKALGDWGDGDSTSRARDTALSQLIEARANRQTQFSVIVFDRNRSSQALLKAVEDIKWFAGAGFVVIIDHDRADYSHLFLAIDLLRSMTEPGVKVFDDSVLEGLLARMSRDLATILQTRELLKENHQNLKKIAASIEKHAVLVEFTLDLIKRGLNEGRLDARLVLEIYRGEGVVENLKPRIALIEKEFPGLDAPDAG